MTSRIITCLLNWHCCETVALGTSSSPNFIFRGNESENSHMNLFGTSLNEAFQFKATNMNEHFIRKELKCLDEENYLKFHSWSEAFVCKYQGRQPHRSRPNFNSDWVTQLNSSYV